MTLLWHDALLFDLYTDNDGVLLFFSFASKAMTVMPLRSIPFIEVFFPAVGDLSAGLHSLPVVQFALSFTGDDLNCSRVVFDYSASLFCNFSNGSLTSDVAFFAMEAVNNSAQIVYKGTSRASCRFFVAGWKFMTVGSCGILVKIPVLAISVVTPPFSVKAGTAVSGILVGFLPSQIKGASSIWSINSSGILCVAAHLSDAFDNPVSVSEETFLLSAFLFGTAIPYKLLGDTTARTDNIGIARWCNVQVSAVSSQLICLRISGASINWSLPTCTNVSRSGVASALSWGSMNNAFNSTPHVISGAGLPSFKFAVSDGAGNVASDSERHVVIRLRVVRSVFNRSSLVYVY